MHGAAWDQIVLFGRRCFHAFGAGMARRSIALWAAAFWLRRRHPSGIHRRGSILRGTVIILAWRPGRRTSAGDANAVAVASDDDAVAGALDLVRPFRPGRHAVGAGGEAQRDEGGRKQTRRGGISADRWMLDVLARRVFAASSGRARARRARPEPVALRRCAPALRACPHRNRPAADVILGDGCQALPPNRPSSLCLQNCGYRRLLRPV